MTRALFPFARSKKENGTIEQKSAEIQRELPLIPARFKCQSSDVPHAATRGITRIILNRRTQRQIFKQKITEITKGALCSCELGIRGASLRMFLAQPPAESLLPNHPEQKGAETDS
jgi:hypothetical protein